MLHDLVPFAPFRNVKNSHGGVLLLVKLLAKKPATLLKVTFLHGCFSYFLNCTNGTKSRKTSQVSSLTGEDAFFPFEKWKFFYLLV